MEQVFSYIIGLGAAVMMPVIFTVLGLCIGIKFDKALKSGLLVGVGFVGLSVVTALLTSSLGAPLKTMTEIYNLKLGIFDMGWPAAAAVAYNTTVGAFIIPVCLGINILLLMVKATKTINIDLWNYWHYAFIGAVVYFATDNIWWGFFAAIICFIITLIMADLTTKKFQEYYKDLDGISIPQPFCQGFVPFAYILNKGMDKIPGFSKLDIDAEGLKKKFGILGEPLFPRSFGRNRYWNVVLQKLGRDCTENSFYTRIRNQNGCCNGIDSKNHCLVYRRFETYSRCYQRVGCQEIQKLFRHKYRYESGIGDRTPDDLSCVAAAYPCYTIPICGTSGQ